MRKMNLGIGLGILLFLSVLTACGGSQTANEVVEVEFYYPVQVGGAVADLIESYCTEFEEENSNIDIKPVFSGSYQDTVQKLITSVQSGTAPQMAILANTTLLTMLSLNAIEPLDTMIAKDGGEEYINDFFAGFMANSMHDGNVYSIPFQRSALLMFYNKDHFREVGLDPELPPTTWEEMADMAEVLSKFDSNGNAERWGIMIPSSGAWNFQPFAISNNSDNSNIMSEDGTEVYFNTPENIEALEYLRSLSERKASPEGVIKMETAPASFISGNVSMTHLSSGNLTNINNSVDFDYGIAILPKAERYASISGGGNIYMLKGSTSEEQEATWKFIRFLTDSERQAEWNVATGYVAARRSSFESEIMNQYFKELPGAETVLEQLEYCYNELLVYESEKIATSLTSAYDFVMTGSKTPEQALFDLQAESDAILSAYK